MGAGFAGLESAGYAFRLGVDTNSVQAIFDNIRLRGLLAPGGHVIWTAMVGSAIWKVRGDKPFQPGMLLHRDVVRRWLMAVIMHGIWDAHLPLIPSLLKLALLIVLGWYFMFAILKQAIDEVEQARLAAAVAS